jgi:hypothetical protein
MLCSNKIGKNTGRTAFWGIAMRTSTWAIFLFVSLKGIASVSAALAAPATEATPTPALAGPSAAVERLASDEQRPRPLVQVNSERKPAPVEAKTLSLSSPKPVQIYWFFGGR